MGRMMRRMMEASGQKLPTEMGEMLQRLEKGENPDKLEEEYGDVMEKMDGMEGFFQKIGIYAHEGQKYEPVDSEQLSS